MPRLTDREWVKTPLLILFCLWTIAGCSSTALERMQRESDRARPHPAGYAADDFTFNRPRPERSERRYEFYYKHCSFVGREPYPDANMYSCTEPY